MARRDQAIDVIRGIAILSMVIAHTAMGSPLGKLSHADPWVDGATGFVLLAGLVMGMVQVRVPTFGAGLKKLGRRARLLWFAHVSIVFLALALQPWDKIGRVSPPSLSQLGGWPSAAWQAVTLRINPVDLDILSMYVLLFGVAVLGVMLMRAGLTWLFLAGSGILYLAGMVFRHWAALPRSPGHEGYFSIATWQGLFAIGLIVGWHWRSRDVAGFLSRKRVAVTAGTIVVVLAVLAQPIQHLHVLRPWPALDQTVMDTFANDSIGPGRILIGCCVFAALYYLLSGDRLGKGKVVAVALFNRIGQRSLDSFVILCVFVVVLPVVAPYRQERPIAMVWSVVVFAVVWLWAKLRAVYDGRQARPLPVDTSDVPRDHQAGFGKALTARDRSA